MLLTILLMMMMTAAPIVRGQRQPRGCVIDNIDMCGYESHRQMIDKLMRLQQLYPNIVQVETNQKGLKVEKTDRMADRHNELQT